MKLSIIVATLEGCSFDVINDAAHIENVLAQAVTAGGFQLLHSHVHRFVPQGVTGSAVLAESHINVHSWPEDGVLFVDIATCSTAAATRAAFERICQLVPHERVRRQEVDYQGASAGEPSELVAAPSTEENTSDVGVRRLDYVA